MTNAQAERELEQLAVAACRRAKADLKDGEQRLTAAREAGRLLLALPRTPGKRKKTSSSGLTRLQEVIREAGVSRQAAHAWTKAAEISDVVVADYVAQSRAADEDISIAGLLRWAKPGARPATKDLDDQDAPCTICPKCGTLVGVAA
jgi:hypothetical protein